MGNGCALFVVVMLIVLFISSLLSLPESGIHGFALAAFFGFVIFAWIIRPIIQGFKESSSSNYEQSSINRSSGSGQSSEKNDILDAAIAAGIAYSMLKSTPESDDVHDENDLGDEYDWDKDDHDFESDDWDEDW